MRGWGEFFTLLSRPAPAEYHDKIQFFAEEFETIPEAAEIETESENEINEAVETED